MVGKVFGGLAIVAASVALLFQVAPPSGISHQLDHLSAGWVVVSFLLELLSCLCYPVVFRRFFPEPPPAVSIRVAWIAMGAGAVLPGGNIASAGATGLLLRKYGIGTARLVGRCAALLMLLTLFGFLVNGIVGLALLLHAPGGPHNLFHAGGPLLVSIAVIGSATGLMFWARRAGDGAHPALRVAGSGVEGAWQAVLKPNPRLLGAAGFLLFDIGSLWAAGHATGHPIGMLALMLAYFIGYLATLLPVPAGIGVLDAGLAGTLVLYGMKAGPAAAAVLVYHAISIWLPAVGGLIAWVPVRRRASVTLAPAAA
jgi:uncharacterized membrane protein YbhN (UPF0104 family)